MFNTRQFSIALRRHITEQYSDGEIFTLFDLTDIAESFGKPSRAVAYILRAMHRKGQLKVVGELVNKKRRQQHKALHRHRRRPGATENLPRLPDRGRAAAAKHGKSRAGIT